MPFRVRTHLWDPDKVYEKAAFTPGNELPVADIHFPRRNQTVTVGILICFDCEFPEPSRILALKGASVIIISTAIVDEMTPRTIVPCRATENHVFIVYSNLSGPCTANPAVDCCFCGQSAIIAPDGEELVRSPVEGGGLLHATLHGARYANHVHRNNYLVERRPDIYGSSLGA
jgi:5-aminopentanamidase